MAVSDLVGPSVQTVPGSAVDCTRAAVLTASPATNQEHFWHVHPHPARKGRKPFEG